MSKKTNRKGSPNMFLGKAIKGALSGGVNYLQDQFQNQGGLIGNMVGGAMGGITGQQSDPNAGGSGQPGGGLKGIHSKLDQILGGAGGSPAQKKVWGKKV